MLPRFLVSFARWAFELTNVGGAGRGTCFLTKLNHHLGLLLQYFGGNDCALDVTHCHGNWLLLPAIAVEFVDHRRGVSGLRLLEAIVQHVEFVGNDPAVVCVEWAEESPAQFTLEDEDQEQEGEYAVADEHVLEYGRDICWCPPWPISGLHGPRLHKVQRPRNATEEEERLRQSHWQFVCTTIHQVVQ